MNLNARFAACCAALTLLAAASGGRAAQPPAPGTSPASSAPPASAKSDSALAALPTRPAWTISRITGSPEPPLPYLTERVFPSLKFDQPLDIATAPGSDRLFVVEQSGKIFSFPNDPQVQRADLVIDVAKAIPGTKQVYAIAFHPQFERNRFVYLCCIRDPELKDGTRVSRFRMSDTDPPTIDAASEQLIITWLSGGHNGCCLKFGPDGYLYISTGDGVGPNPPDTLKTGQDISDLLSSILRIDVDHTDGERNYRIPADNPFITLQGARPEVWAYGFRNPWRMSFDRKSGDLWVGDVGWELWELVYRVERGGNYGWGVMEGRQPTNPEWPRGPTPILPPTIDHPHSESSSVTGGVTYFGSQLPELVGAYIYGDYDTGKIWGLRWENGKIVWHKELADTTLRIVGFGEDSQGEMYLVDHIGGTLHRLVLNPDQGKPSPFPRRLSETGLFATSPPNSLAAQTPAPGVLRFTINSELWQDGAVAERFVGLPGEARIKTQGDAWQFPTDAVLAKTLSLETRPGDPASRRRVETQILHFTGIEWRAYTYAWNGDQTDAELIGALGEDRPIEMVDPQAPGGRQKRTWHFAGRAECMRCHNPWSGSALSFNVPQLNRAHDYPPQTVPQLDALHHLGVIEPAIPADKRPRLADPHDESFSLNDRARSYLHANCAHCHRMHAGSSVLSKMQYDLPLEQTSMVGVRPTQGTFSIHAAHVVSPGDPFRSVMLYRMSKLGNGRMPHLGAQMVDPFGVELIHQWIASLPADKVEDPTGNEVARARRAEERKLLDQLAATPRGNTDAARTLVEKLLSTTSGALMLLRAVDEQHVPAETVPVVVATAMARQEVEVRDLFERFLPEDQRVKRLGSVIRPEQILRLKGDATRGKTVFLEAAGVQCKNCHRIGNVGKEVGPDLSQIGKKYDRGQLLESILDPSKLIDPKYVTYLVETRDGRLLTGLLVRKDGQQVVLKDAQDNQIVVPTAEIERLAGQAASLMPELLLRDLTAEQVADLLEYLSTLR